MNGQEIIILIQGEQLQKGIAPFPAPPPCANGMFFFLRNCQAGHVIITLQFVPKTVVVIINVLIHKKYYRIRQGLACADTGASLFIF